MAKVVLVGAGGDEVVVTNDRWVATRPSFSPNGQRLAVARAVGDYESAGPEGIDLWVVSTDGSSAPRQVTRGEYVGGGPDWSPSGDKLLYSVPNPSDRSWQIRSVPADRRGQPTTLIETAPGATVLEPRWSPDGTQIAYLVASSPKGDGSVVTELWVATPSGEGRRIAEVPDANWLSWSPDGQGLLVSTLAAKRGRVLLVDLKSSAVTVAAEHATLARFAPNGGPIVYFTQDTSAASQAASTTSGTTVPDGKWRLASGTLESGTLERAEVSSAPEEYLYSYYGMDPKPCGP